MDLAPSQRKRQRHQMPEAVQGSRAATTTSYGPLGNLLAAIAAKRRADESRTIAQCMGKATGHRVSHREISSYLGGRGLPSPKFMRSFAKTFSLTVEERRKLAWMYTFSRPPD